MRYAINQLPHAKFSTAERSRFRWKAHIERRVATLRGKSVELAVPDGPVNLPEQICWFGETDDGMVLAGCVPDLDSAWLAGVLVERLPAPLARACLLQAFIAIWQSIARMPAFRLSDLAGSRGGLTSQPQHQALPQSQSQSQVFSLTCRSTGSLGRVQIYFYCRDDRAAVAFLDCLPPPVAQARQVASLQKRLLLNFKGPTLLQRELAGIAPGDLLIFWIHQHDCESATVQLCCPLRSIAPIPAHFDQHHRSLTIAPASAATAEGIPMNDPESSALFSPSELRFETSIELPMVALSHAQLCALSVGSVIPIPSDLENIVGRLSLGGQSIATGRLVQWDGKLGLEITKVAQQESTDSDLKVHDEQSVS